MDTIETSDASQKIDDITVSLDQHVSVVAALNDPDQSLDQNTQQKCGAMRRSDSDEPRVVK